MNDQELKEVFKKRNDVRKLMQDPLFWNKEYEDSMSMLESIESTLKKFKGKRN